MLKKDVFVFPDMVGLPGRVSLNREGDVYTLRYTLDDNSGQPFVREVVIDTEAVCDGNVAMVMFCPITNDMIVHYGFSQICESLNMTHSEFLQIVSVYGLMQVDRYQERVFCKVFLPKKQHSLDSVTDDYSDNAYMTADCVHPLDWQYMPTYDLVNAKVEDGRLELTLGVCRPAVNEAMGNMHINYAGQCLELADGEHTYVFKYVKGENAYIGYPYSRRKGRMIDIERAVMLCIK